MPIDQPQATTREWRTPRTEGFVYLGCPYSHNTPAVRQARVDLASQAAALAMLHGVAVFSPITHGHAVADHLPGIAAQSHSFWMDQCLPMLQKSKALWVLPLKGWRQSRGLQEEIHYAKAHAIPIVLIQRLPDPSHAGLEQLQPEELSELGWKLLGMSAVRL